MKKYILGVSFLALAVSASLSSCSDFFETESTHFVDAEKDHLHNATDSIYSVIGILNKVQAIADRTILLGEARGELVNLTPDASSDLRDIALFQAGDDNEYNQPRDYYAIINNCNYFIANADTSLINNRNERLFLKEYAAIKAVRAWTYLQLVTLYGRVPFVTEPILNKVEAERDYPMYDIKQVCDYFINEDGLDALVDVPYPGYSDIKGLNSQLFYFPVRLVLGDLNLWAGNYWEAAKCYYEYIAKRNGENSIYPTMSHMRRWMTPTWSIVVESWTTMFNATNETYSPQGELITIIPGDSIPSEGYYSQLRNIFNTTDDNGYRASLTPSQVITDLSESQTFCLYTNAGAVYAPVKDNHRTGDLRLSGAWTTSQTIRNGNRIDEQQINKYKTRNIHIYRRAQVYLRLAEAINRAGYPRFAFHILSTGINNEVIRKNIEPYYHDDSLKLVTTFNFPSTAGKYILVDPRSNEANQNTMGIHSRGCGDTPYNEYYQMPFNEAITDSLEQIAWQQVEVENLIVDELALECAFEGIRFSDLMRVALRRNDPAYLANKIKQREKSGSTNTITVDLTNPANWYLHWNNQIGY